MKTCSFLKFFWVLILLLLLGTHACEDEKQAMSFRMDENTESIQNFTWGESRIYKISTQEVERVSVLSAPRGWKVVADLEKLEVKAPRAEEEISDVQGGIVLFLANSKNSLQVQLQVEIPTSLVIDLSQPSLFDKSEVLWVKNAQGDTVAQACREYARAANASPEKAIRAIVVYAYDAAMKTFRKGLVVNNGGTVRHDGSEYKDGGKAPVNTVCLVEGYCSATGNGSGRPRAFLVPDTASDVDGNVYGVVKIGTQYWMRENLRTFKYRDGSEIGTDASWYKDDLTDVGAFEHLRKLFGLQYETKAAVREDLAPEGWHVGGDEDWIKMELFLGMLPEETYMNGSKRAERIGQHLKSEGEEWQDHGGGLNFSGFRAVPGGSGGSYGRAIKVNGYYCTPKGKSCYYRMINAVNTSVVRGLPSFLPAMSIRCVRND